MTTETMTPAADAAANEGVAAPAPVGATAPAAERAAPQQVTIVETPKPSYDEELSAIYDKVNTPAPDKAPAQNAKTVAAALVDTDEPELPLDLEITDPPEDTPSEPATPAIAAPNSWSTEQKAKWSTLPPATQSYIADREKDAHAKITQQGNELRQYQPVREIYEHIRTLGVPAGREPEVIANWARAQAALDQNPGDGLKWLAKSYGVDLAQLAGNTTAKSENETIDDLFRDPRLDRIAPEVNELRNQVGALQRQLQARTHAESSSRQRQVEDVISTFSNRDDVKDNWNVLETDIIHEIEVLKASDPNLVHDYEKLLAKAYDRALYANPESRARILADQQRKAQEVQEVSRKKEAEEAAKKQAQAKKVASMNVRTGATASTPTFDGKWDDKARLGAIYDRIQTGNR